MNFYKYNSIGQFKNTIKNIKSIFFKNNIFELPIIPFIGTVKVHGTNASIVLNDDFYTQSKNNILTPEFDNYGFSNYIHSKKNDIQPILIEIKNKLNVDTLIIHGEWCGEEIQKNVAIENISKKFIIFDIKTIKNNEEHILTKEIIDDLYLPYKTLLNNNSIYSIYDFPHWALNIDFNNPLLIQNKLVELTLNVEKECPVAKYFGVSGIGEGIVWRNSSNLELLKNIDLTFKVKGKEHSVSNVTSLASVDTEKVNSNNHFVENFLTENRLNQGIQYLKDNFYEIKESNIKIFINWMIKDCLKEEGDVIESSNLNKNDLTKMIAFKSKTWFLSHINNNLKLKLK